MTGVISLSTLVISGLVTPHTVIVFTELHYKDGGSASVIPELSLWAACVIVRHLQSSVSPMQLWVSFQ